MSFSRKELMKLSDNYEIFRINQLNILTTQTQKSERRLFRVPPKTLEERIIRFFESHCLRPAGEKTFHIKMTRLAEEMNVKRIYVSNALNEMEKKDSSNSIEASSSSHHWKISLLKIKS